MVAVDESSVPVVYPRWFYYPARERPPQWAREFVGVVAAAKGRISTADGFRVTSDQALAALEPGPRSLGYEVEASKSRANRIRRPVLFGDNGVEVLAWEVDAVHDGLGIVVEVEAGRGAKSNAVYRDLIRTSLIVDARFLALGVQISYRHDSSGESVAVQSYADTKSLLDAIYASGRLKLPFEGILLFGY